MPRSVNKVFKTLERYGASYTMMSMKKLQSRDWRIFDLKRLAYIFQ
jgi:hypothetical protein